MAKEGLTARLTTAGLPVLRLHYSADEHKDPATKEGARWVARASLGYKGGVLDHSWLKEMEIQYGALGGQLLFPTWEQDKRQIVCQPFAIQDAAHVKFYGTYDHGFVHHAAYHVHAVLPNGQKYTVWEFAGSHVPIRAIAEIIKGQTIKLQHDGRTFEGNPYAGREVVRICDPQIFARTGSMGDDPFNSVGDVFRDKYQVAFQKGRKGGQMTCAEMLLGDLWADTDTPKYQVFAPCKRLLFELPRLRFKQISSQQQLTKNMPDQLVDKDNDAWDSLCQFLHLFPSTVAPKSPKNIAGTFAYHQKQLQTRKPLANSYSRV